MSCTGTYMLLALTIAVFLGSETLSPSFILRPTVSRPVCLGIKHPSGACADLYYCLTVTVLFFVGALSDERTGLSFVYAAGPRQRSPSRVRVLWYSRPYTGRSRSRAHQTKQLYFAGLMHKLQDVQHLLLMFIIAWDLSPSEGRIRYYKYITLSHQSFFNLPLQFIIH
jgi:hypothetical protein